MHQDIAAYNDSMSPADKAICALAGEVCKDPMGLQEHCET